MGRNEDLQEAFNYYMQHSEWFQMPYYIESETETPRKRLENMIDKYIKAIGPNTSAHAELFRIQYNARLAGFCAGYELAEREKHDIN